MATPDTALDRRPLGKNTGLEVTCIGTGLWAVTGSQWGPGDDRATLDAIDAAIDHGVNFFDTADVYGGGRSEELLGRAMKGRRDRFVLATKIGWVNYDGQNNRSQYDSVDKLIAGVDESLKRMQTDYADAIQCHIFYHEPNTPVFIDGFRRLKEMGKVRAWGVSTSDVSLLKTFNEHGDCDVLQVDYSILNRTPEADLLPYCHEHGIGVIVRGPLAMGLLAGKFTPQTTFAEGDFRRDWTTEPGPRKQYEADLAAVDQLRPGIPADQSMAQFALRFVISHPAVSAAIPGARNPEQARSNTAAGRLGPLSPTELAAVDAVVPPKGGRKIWPA